MDYELTLTIKNAPLLNMMRERGYRSIAKLAQDIGIGRNKIDRLARLKCGVYRTDGVTPMPSAERIAEFFSCSIEDLVPSSHVRDPLRQEKFVAQVAEHQMKELAQAAQDPVKLLEVFETESRDAFSDMLDSVPRLNERCRRAMELRFKHNKTLGECADEMGICRERARQILNKSLRFMRHDSTHLRVIEAAGIYADNTGLGD